MAYTLGVMKTAFSPTILREAIADAAIRNQLDGLCWSFSNHDVERAASRWNPGGRHRGAFALLQLAMLVTLPGSACLYQGEELGLPQARLPASATRDPFGRTFSPVYAGRDGARTPMPWIAGAANSGFSTAPPWLPIDPAHDALAVDRQAADPDSTLACCRRLLHWRKSHPALTSGGVELLPTADPVVAWRRSEGNDRIIAIFNTSDEAQTLSPATLPAFAAASELGFGAAPSNGELRLPPFGVCLGTEHGNR
jgi:alpha-glucosidase